MIKAICLNKERGLIFMKNCLNKKRWQYCRIEGRVVDEGKHKK